MKKMGLIAGVLLVLGASMASAGGINLSWNDCGAAGTANATFACDVSTGIPFTAIASFIAPHPLPQFVGLASQVDVTTDQATLPDWWAHGTGFCRGSTGMSISFDFTGGPFSCTDFWLGQAAGGFAYDVGFGTAARGRIRIQCAVPFENRAPIDDVSEIYAYKLNLLRAKTTGTGSCAGCNFPACIVLNEIQAFQPPELADDPEITNSANQSYVTWQGAPATTPPCPQSTPTHSSSWGQVKSLYR
jgi:hypothetical protein